MPDTTVSEKPILFSGPMVRAILDGSKTQTRRVVKPQPKHLGNDVWEFRDDVFSSSQSMGEHLFHNVYGANDQAMPYGGVYADADGKGFGDRLWVRECWAPSVDNGLRQIAYAADGRWGSMTSDLKPVFHGWVSGVTDKVLPDWAQRNGNWLGRKYFTQWKPSIHMPRWACRLTLEITDVRVERLAGITSQDAWAEGCRCECTSPVPMCAGNIEAFQKLWESINGAGSWDANPWVWVISFRRLEVANAP